MIFSEGKDNLFNLDEKYALAHCISLDCAMGAGIAVTFAKTYDGMKNYCKMIVKNKELEYPCVIPYYGKGRIIFNLVTKEKYFNKPTYESLTKAVQDMARICKVNKIKYLGIPKLGCGLDRLDWKVVREIIQNEFKDMDIEIQVKYL